MSFSFRFEPLSFSHLFLSFIPVGYSLLRSSLFSPLSSFPSPLAFSSLRFLASFVFPLTQLLPHFLPLPHVFFFFSLLRYPPPAPLLSLPRSLPSHSVCLYVSVVLSRSASPPSLLTLCLSFFSPAFVASPGSECALVIIHFKKKKEGNEGRRKDPCCALFGPPSSFQRWPSSRSSAPPGWRL